MKLDKYIDITLTHKELAQRLGIKGKIIFTKDNSFYIRDRKEILIRIEE